MTRRVIHTITPGDHFSPRTGSAIPTVVHGLAAAAEASGDPRHAVLVDRSTYHPRYASAEAIEYAGAPPPSRGQRRADVVRAALGMRRRAAQAYFAPLAAVALQQPPAVILAHNAAVLPSLLEASEHRVAVYMHNQLFRTYRRGEAERMLRGTAAIICVSRSLADETTALLPGSLTSRIHVIENGVDTELFHPAASRRHDGALRVLFVGRVIPEKGADILLRAVAGFAPGELAVRIIGSRGFDANAPLSGHERELRMLADRVAVDVEFSPFLARAQIAAAYRDADVLVVPSRWAEPSGLTVGEGMASGLAVVASDVGGIAGVLGDAGILIPADDPVALAAALRRLSVSPRRRADTARAARARAEARDWRWAWGELRRLLATL